MKVVTEYSGCNYITAGKEYELNIAPWDGLASICDDDGDDIVICTTYPCAHLDDIGEWEIVE